MRKIFYCIITILISFFCFSQNTNTFPASGNVGIGTTTPIEKLHIEKGNFLLDSFNTGNESGIFFRGGYSTSNIYNLSILAYDHYNSGKPTGISINGYDAISFSTGSNKRNERMRIDVKGNVGIGTTDPNGKLDINFGGWGSIPRVVFKSITDNPGINFYRPTGSAATAYPWRIEENLGALEFQTGSNANIGSETLIRKFYIDNNKAFFTDNVGIGTENPDSKLTVKGSIHAEEVRVDLNIAPDYVFEKYYDGFSALNSEYKMPTLQEVEAYTKENKHLPEVPSAQEIKENGLKLGEMNAILLQKVEELTLYLIEQNKEIEKLKTKVDELSKK